MIHVYAFCAIVGLPLFIRSLILLGANTYRAGQSNTAPPPLLELPTLPRFKTTLSSNGKGKRDESERLPEV